MNMSFLLTTDQFLARTKTVTRRLGWKHLEAGTVLHGVEKAQGLRRGERVRMLGTIRVLDVRTEVLGRMQFDPDYGRAEAALEGFPDLDGRGFVLMFCKANRCLAARPVRRILFEYVLGHCPRCEGTVHTVDFGATCAKCLLVFSAGEVRRRALERARG